MSFETTGLVPQLIESLEKLGIKIPTDIQNKVIPAALAGKDIIAQSPTGTGKTLSYLLPLIQRLDLEKKEPQAIILAPTHELAIQIHRQVENLNKHSLLKTESMPVIGDVNIDRQIEKLKKNKPQVLIGSSGRLLELIQKKKIKAVAVKTIVLDEADRLLDDDNITGVTAVIKTVLKKERQLLAVSATMTSAALKRAGEIMNDPETITGGREDVPSNISHWYFTCQERDKVEILKKLVVHLNVKKALVFINNSHTIERMAERLNFHGLTAAALFGGSGKINRQGALEGFRRGEVRLLVTSDLGARGLDIPDAPYVFNLEMPEEPGFYLHRAGRTGRAGQSGLAISIVSEKELPLIKKAEKSLNISILPKITTHGKVFDKRP